MPMDEATSSVCASCGTVRRIEANYCGQCGRAYTASFPSPAQSKNARWYHNVWFVLFMLFFVLGPFGLPLAWKNPRFSRALKMALTLAMVLYTFLLIDLTLKMARAIMGQVSAFNATLSAY